MPLALVTVSSSEFFLGTKVLFRSFLIENPSFSGDLIIIDTGLEIYQKKALSLWFDAKFENLSDKISDKINSLSQKLPHYLNTKQRFASLFAFQLENYDKILFCDSDMLCESDVMALFYHSSEFAACPDPRALQGFWRNEHTFLHSKPDSIPENYRSFFIPKLFNTGLMVIDKKLIASNIYENMLEYLVPRNFQHIKTGHTDTVVLNRLLLNKAQWLDPDYNRYWPLLKETDKVNGFIHFIWKPKPWSKESDGTNKWVKKWRKYAGE
jgi:lipopolysaccharide biosynthesis glycosyltransferase